MDKITDLIKGMTPPQQEAVLHKRGPMMVLAGPGSGKTFVLTRRIAQLIRSGEASPDYILVVTFTRMAAEEMKSRFLQIMGETSTAVTFGTFHSVFYRIIRAAYGQRAGTIMPENQKYQVLQEIVHARGLEIEDEKEFIQGVLSEISVVKGEMMDLQNYYSVSCPSETFRRIFTDYQHYMDSHQLIDFDDMQTMCYELLSQRPDILAAWQRKFRYILVDEFQDICRIQYELVKMLALPENNLFIVGDDDQSIYRFRGARPEIMLGFERDFPGTKSVLLDVNFRCDRNIVYAAGLVIGKNKTRFPKKISSSRMGTQAVLVRRFDNSEKQYASIISDVRELTGQGVKAEEIAVLFRTVRSAGGLVHKLMEYSIPFQMRDTMPDIYSHFIARDLFAYIRIGMGSRSRADFLEIINKPNRYISRSLLDQEQITFDGLAARFQGGRSWMADRIWTMEMQMRSLGRMTPYAAITFIRNAVGYDQYLEEYAKYRKMKPSELYDILDEIQESARDASTFQDWFDQIERYREELKDQIQRLGQQKQGLVLATMHAAKGLEYEYVYIIDANEGTIPHEKAVLEEDIEEERRLFYVAMTRAKNRLVICSTKERFGKAQKESRFVKEFMGAKKARPSGKKPSGS